MQIRTAFQNIFKIPELKSRVLFTLALLTVYRIGAHIPTPGINGEELSKFLTEKGGNIMMFFDMFSGGALSRVTIFALGIMPYISASIILQLLTVVIPAIGKIAKEGEAGRKKIIRYTRYGTVVISAIQSFGIAVGLESMSQGAFIQNPGWSFRPLTLPILLRSVLPQLHAHRGQPLFHASCCCKTTIMINDYEDRIEAILKLLDNPSSELVDEGYDLLFRLWLENVDNIDFDQDLSSIAIRYSNLIQKFEIRINDMVIREKITDIYLRNRLRKLSKDVANLRAEISKDKMKIFISCSHLDEAFKNDRLLCWPDYNVKVLLMLGKIDVFSQGMNG